MASAIERSQRKCQLSNCMCKQTTHWTIEENGISWCWCCCCCCAFCFASSIFTSELPCLWLTYYNFCFLTPYGPSILVASLASPAPFQDIFFFVIFLFVFIVISCTRLFSCLALCHRYWLLVIKYPVLLCSLSFSLCSVSGQYYRHVRAYFKSFKK